jgi:hypothetical protein
MFAIATYLVRSTRHRAGSKAGVSSDSQNRETFYLGPLHPAPHPDEGAEEPCAAMRRMSSDPLQKTLADDWHY